MQIGIGIFIAALIIVTQKYGFTPAVLIVAGFAGLIGYKSR